MGLIQDWFKYKQRTELSSVEKKAQDSSMNLNVTGLFIEGTWGQQ